MCRENDVKLHEYFKQLSASSICVKESESQTKSKFDNNLAADSSLTIEQSVDQQMDQLEVTTANDFKIHLEQVFVDDAVNIPNVPSSLLKYVVSAQTVCSFFRSNLLYLMQ